MEEETSWLKTTHQWMDGGRNELIDYQTPVDGWRKKRVDWWPDTSWWIEEETSWLITRNQLMDGGRNELFDDQEPVDEWRKKRADWLLGTNWWIQITRNQLMDAEKRLYTNIERPPSSMVAYILKLSKVLTRYQKVITWRYSFEVIFSSTPYLNGDCQPLADRKIWVRIPVQVCAWRW